MKHPVSHNAFKRAFCALLILSALISTLAFCSCSSPKAETLTETVNLANPRKNMRGEGYDWANLDNILTLNGLNIVTDDEFGMKLPADATVILNGDNYISAATCGLVCTGKVTFKGNGTLTVVAGEIGISCTSVYKTDVARFTSGKIDITAGKLGMTSDHADITVMGSEMTITLNNSDALAIDGVNISVTSGSLTSNAPIHASNSLTMSASDVTVTSEGSAALSCPNGITFNSVSLKAGSSSDNLVATDEYSAQNAVKLTSTASSVKKGTLFGGSYPRFFDYLIIIFLILLLASSVTAPIIIKRKRTAKLVAEYNASQKEQKKKK